MSPRRAQQNAGVYILTPTEQNVHRIVADFSNGHRTYTSAHLFFTDGM
jgi:syntaxin-binding protein 1